MRKKLNKLARQLAILTFVSIHRREVHLTETHPVAQRSDGYLSNNVLINPPDLYLFQGELLSGRISRWLSQSSVQAASALVMELSALVSLGRVFQYLCLGNPCHERPYLWAEYSYLACLIRRQHVPFFRVGAVSIFRTPMPDRVILEFGHLSFVFAALRVQVARAA